RLRAQPAARLEVARKPLALLPAHDDVADDIREEDRVVVAVPRGPFRPRHPLTQRIDDRIERYQRVEPRVEPLEHDRRRSDRWDIHFDDLRIDHLRDTDDLQSEPGVDAGSWHRADI